LYHIYINPIQIQIDLS